MRKLAVILFLCLIEVGALCSSLAIAAPYRLKSGDALDINIWEDQKLNRQVIVAPDGTIAFPLVGRFRVAGSTLSTVESTLGTRLEKFYKEKLNVTVSLLQEAKVEEEEPEWTIYVTGEVNRPGQFVSKTSVTVLQAIALSGGLAPFAAAHRIQIHRKSKGGDQVFEFDYGLSEEGPNPGGNLVLRNGDVVVVPERGLFE